MKITLYMATTIDGLIATSSGDADWVSPVDAASFEKAIAEYGCIIVGRKTFDQFQGDIYPVNDVTNIVITSDSSKTSDEENVFYVKSNIDDILALVAEKGHDQALLIGGGATNALFLKENKIDEIIVTIHPLILGNGIRLFSGDELKKNLYLKSVKELGDGLIQARYEVIRE